MTITLASPQLLSQISTPLAEAILKTLAYSDIFDYPLTLDEIHTYLVVPATKEEIKTCIEKIHQIRLTEKYYYLTGRDEIVHKRKNRALKSIKIFKRALFYGKVIGKFPFVRMVALTGSLAMLNLSNEIDIDFMLITKSNRLWFARALAVTFGRLMRLLGDRICINLLIAENNLSWSQHDLYSAREICQMIPISGFDTHCKFRVANMWTLNMLPNALLNEEISNHASALQKLWEVLFLGKLGNQIEKLAMDFQMKIISRRENNSTETNFTADICQGNFHQHKKWTQIEYEKRLSDVVASHARRDEATSSH